MVGSAGGEAGACLIIHDKQVTAIEMPVHFFDLVLINNVGFLDAVKLGGVAFQTKWSKTGL